jgi:hypothetical protein
MRKPRRRSVPRAGRQLRPFSARAAVLAEPERRRIMSEPLVVTIPHRLGKEEALRRIRGGLARAESEFAWALRFDEQRWEGDRLAFRISAIGQHAQGSIDVGEDSVRVEVMLPWLLARFARAAQRAIGQSGAKMLEKK